MAGSPHPCGGGRLAGSTLRDVSPDRRDPWKRQSHPARSSSSTTETPTVSTSLWWNADEDRTYVFVDDGRTGQTFRIAVEAGDALDVFHHPYAYVEHAAG
jgi:hypothetical protein